MDNDEPISREDIKAPTPTGEAAELEKPTTVDPESGDAPQRTASERTITGPKWAFVVFSILSAVFLFAIDNTILGDVQPAILRSFGHLNELPWLSVSFALSSAALNLSWGKLYGLFNIKILYLGAVFFFEAASAVMGAANSMNLFIAARAVAGVFAVGLYIGANSIISVVTTERERPLYVALIGLVWGLGTVLGPIIGGGFAGSSATWRWGFYINLCVGAVGAPIWIFLLPSHDPRPGVPIRTRIKSFDYVGSLLNIGYHLCLILGTNLGGTLYSWHSGRIIALFVLGGVFLLVFVAQQATCLGTTKENRLLALHFFKSRALALMYVHVAAGVSSMFVPIFIIPVLFQFTKGDGPLEGGVRLLPYVAVLVFAILLNGALMAQWGYYAPWFVVGSAVAIIGSALMFTIGAETSSAKIYGYFVLYGFGLGIYVLAPISICQLLVEKDEVADAVSFISSSQVSAVAFGVSISQAVFFNKSVGGIQHAAPSLTHLDAVALIAGTNSALLPTLPQETQRAIINAIVKAASSAFAVPLSGTALGFVLSLLLPFERLEFPQPGK